MATLPVAALVRAAERYEAAQEGMEALDLCVSCEPSPGLLRHVMVAGRCIICNDDDHSIGNTDYCETRPTDDPPLVWTSELGAHTVVRTETGSVYLIDTTATR